MTKSFILLPTVLSLMACGGGDPMPQSETAAQATSGRSMLTPKPWAQLAPGVWERVREDGIRERSSTGIEGLEYDLRLARAERALLAQVHEASSNSSVLNASLAESDQHIQILEHALVEVKNSAMERTPDERLSAQTLTESGQKEGPFCAGGYGFDAQFSYNMAGGAVSMQGFWSEFGPFAPYTKQFYVRARAWMETPDSLQQDSELGPVFTKTCCFSTRQVSTGITPTFTPALEAYGYIIGSDGCGSRSYTARNF